MAKGATVRKPVAEPAPVPSVDVAAMLARAVEARNTGAPLMATHAEMEPLVRHDAGQLVEFRSDVQDGDKFAYRATELGMQVYANETGATGETAPAPVANKDATPKRSAIVAAIPIPSPKRGRGANSYGFENLAVGESFFIEATDERPDPAKGIASTVASAADRLDGREFTVRTIEDGAPWGDQYKGKEGAAVWRTK